MREGRSVKHPALTIPEGLLFGSRGN